MFLISCPCQLFSADTHHLLVRTEEVSPKQQDWSSSLDQEDPPEPRHIKEEEEELWSGQDGEQIQEMEEAEETKFALVPVKSEDHEGSGENNVLEGEVVT